MVDTTVERNALIETVNNLPDEVLLELANFLDYLAYKATQQQLVEHPQNVLLAVASLGESGQSDVADSDEEILRSEVDPIYGLSSRGDEPS